ncbi:MAG: alpha/beta hydrolase-fold protein [Bacteroidota bacterium]
MFRTTEISDPSFESGHLRFITVKTPNLKGRGDICVFVPPMDNLRDVPLVVLLHGVYGSAWVWSQKGGVHRTALQMIRDGEIPPMVIAMPSDGLWGDGSGYLPHNGLHFEKWIVEDVPQAVIENIAMVSEKSSQFISGLSMGGFGALRLGIKYSDRFKAVSAHSSITDLGQMKMFVEEPLENYRQGDGQENSVWGVVEKYAGNLPKVRFDCGTEDELLEANRELHRRLMVANVAHTYEEFPGGHEWSYWQEHVQKSLGFFAERLS